MAFSTIFVALWYGSVVLRSAGSPWNLLRCGRRWTTSSSADCACQMQQPKAFVFRQLIFGINANPHYISPSARFVCDSVWPRRGLLAVCGTYFARHRAAVDFFAPNCPCLFSALSQVCLGTRRMSSDGRRIILRGSGASKAVGPRWHLRGDCRARTGSEAASGTRKRSTSHTARVCAAAQLRGRV